MLLDLLRLSRAVGEASSGKLSGKLDVSTKQQITLQADMFVTQECNISGHCR